MVQRRQRTVPPSHLEYPVCGLCGSARRRIVHANVRDLMYGLPGEFNVVRCSICGLVYLYPRPTKDYLASYYPSNYGPFSCSADAPHEGGRKQTLNLRDVLYIKV